MKLDNLFSTFKIGNTEIKNRLVVPAMSCSYCEPMDGQVTERYIDYYVEKAKGGWGLLITEYTTVDPNGKAVIGQPGLWDDSQIEGHKKLTDAVHEFDTKIFVQLHHAGRETAPPLLNGNPTRTSSAMMSPLMPTIPYEMPTKEVEEVVDRFIDAAVRAKEAGYDGVEVHGGHGYLLAQFMSLYVNKRTDKYGGNMRNRGRIVTEIIEGIKEKCGKDFPVIFRISVEEFTPGGNTIEDVKAFCAMAEDAGCDGIDATVGNYFSIDTVIAHSSKGHGWITDQALEIKNTVNIPVITVNRINDAIIAESILKSGKADAIAMGRESLADPYFPIKAKEGRLCEIRHCLGCLQGCFGHFFAGLPTGCIINPTCGREKELAIKQTEKKKKVFVAGGGPAGMEAAIVAASRGHEVELFEKSSKLGGQLLLAAVPPYKGEFNTFTSWQITELERQNVKVHLDTELTKVLVEQEKPDSVVVATGANPVVPPIDGVTGANVVSANDVLAGKVPVGMSVVVIGGGQVGAETANHLAIHNRKVTVVEMLPQLASQEQGPALKALMKDYAAYGVDTYVSTKVKRITETGVMIQPENGEEITIPAETVVLAVGSRPADTLSEELAGKVEVITVGDAKQVRNAEEAIKEGYEAGFAV